MAVRRQPLALIQDENAEINRGKTNAAKSVGLKVQQTDLSDRKPLSNINNKLKPLPNLGTATPSALRNGKGGFSVRVHPELSGKSGVKDRTVSRTPLKKIENVEGSVQKGNSVAEKKPQSRNLKMGPNPRYEVTEEMKQQAAIWACEGMEKCHYTGKDMDAQHAKMAEEEVNRQVAQALSYRSEIPCWLPSALVKQDEVKDSLELIPEEDVFTNVSSSFDGMEQQDIAYDESFYEWCLDGWTAPDGWPAVIETIDT